MLLRKADIIDKQERAAVISSAALLKNMPLQLDHFRLGGEGIDGCRAMLEVKHRHQVVIHRVHTAKCGFVVVHHGDASFPAGVLFDFTLYTDPSAFVHPTEFDLAVGFHLLIHFLLVVGNDIQLALELADSAKGTHMGLAVLLGGEVEGATIFQIFGCFVHDGNSFQRSCCVFICYWYNYIV